MVEPLARSRKTSVSLQMTVSHLASGRRSPERRSATFRYFPLLLLSIDTDDRVVTQAVLGLAFKLVPSLLWLAEYSLLKSSPVRQTLADKVARTVVVNTPTWEPHRAPAIPMYSATDAEFGHPPSRPNPPRPGG